ncbi:hypothetical protein [Roseibium alexandrii]|uniref:hypothetical protein n=1 Tax=Roseibium alexandrii TaxID=388408 RepID=UPI003753ABC4
MRFPVRNNKQGNAMNSFMPENGDVFGNISAEIISSNGEISHLYHAEDLSKGGLKSRVSEMSDQELLTFISDTAHQRLKAEGKTMKAVDFFVAVARCAREVRKEVS